MSLKLILIAASCLLLSCSKHNFDKIDNLNNGKIFVIGHGGVSFETFRNPLPANSWTSIQKTIDVYNADGVDVDVRISQDNIPFLFHNSFLESETNCSGCVNGMNASKLLNCRYKEDYEVNLFNYETLITLDFVLNKFSDRTDHPLIFIDIKTDNPCNSFLLDYDTLVIKIAECIQKHNAVKWTAIISHETFILNKVKQELPGIRLFIDGNFESTYNAAVNEGYYGISSNTNDISKEQVKKAHDKNIMVLLFGVKIKKSIKDAIKKNPDFLDTDNIQLTQQILLE